MQYPMYQPDHCQYDLNSMEVGIWIELCPMHLRNEKEQSFWNVVAQLNPEQIYGIVQFSLEQRQCSLLGLTSHLYREPPPQITDIQLDLIQMSLILTTMMNVLRSIL